MQSKNKFQLRSFLCLITLANCSPPAPGMDVVGADAVTDGTASGIGPAGGTVTDPSGQATLVIPANALTTPTAIGIEPILDEAPLPEGAVRIGPQFLITPRGTTFAQPARLTLPLDATFRDLLGSAQTEVKVWVRTADGWMLTQPVATTAESVTIELSTATIAAAGVRLGVRLPGCGGAGQPACIDPDRIPDLTPMPQPLPPCGTTFCSQLIVDPATRPSTESVSSSNQFRVQDGVLYWYTGNGLRRNLMGGPIESVTGLGIGGVSDVGANLAVDRDGNLWNGIVRFSFTTMMATRAMVPASFNPVFPLRSGTMFFNGTANIRSSTGAIFGYRRVTRTVLNMTGNPAADTLPEHVAMERWTFNPDLTVTGPVVVAQGVTRGFPFPDRMNPAIHYLAGTATATNGSAASPPASTVDSRRILKLDEQGMILSALDVPIAADGLANGFGANQLCDPGIACLSIDAPSFAARGPDVFHATRPPVNQMNTTIQRIDSMPNPMTRMPVMLPRVLDPIIDMEFDSTGGLWFFTRSATRNQVWHFNRMTNTLSPIALGQFVPHGLVSDGNDGAIVLVRGSNTGVNGFVRVRRLL